MLRPPGVPKDSVAFPLQTLVSYLSGVLSSIHVSIDTENSSIINNYLFQCSEWTRINTINREAGRPLTEKPSIPKLWQFYTLQDSQGQYLWAWQIDDGPDAGSPVADLPPLPVIGTPHIGQFLWKDHSGIEHYRCCPDDTVGDELTIVVVEGRFPGVPAGSYLKHNVVFGSEYERQS